MGSTFANLLSIPPPMNSRSCTRSKKLSWLCKNYDKAKLVRKFSLMALSRSLVVESDAYVGLDPTSVSGIK
jgi:hypothetical protein